jgi:hypothetical protein
MVRGVEPTEQLILKAGLQALSVAIGVFLGWWVNDRSKRQERIADARADWIGAVDTTLEHMVIVAIAIANDPSKESLDQQSDRLLSAHNSATAAGFKLRLVSPRDRAEIDQMSARLLSLNLDHDVEKTDRTVRSIRVDLEEIVSSWADGHSRKSKKLEQRQGQPARLDPVPPTPPGP